MDSNIVTAGSAVMGSMVGAMGSLISTWFAQRYQFRRDHLARQITRRETLYSEFIVEAARLYSDAVSHQADGPQTMVGIWSILSRIRLTASAPVLAAAERLVRRIGDQYQAPNLAPAEIRELYRAGDPLKEFGDAGRLELDALDSDR